MRYTDIVKPSTFANEEVIKSKINNYLDLFERGHKYKKIELNSSFPEFIIQNKEKFNEWIL